MKIARRFVNHGTRILAAVVLLAVMSSPIRLSSASHTATSPDYLPRNLVILNNGCSGGSAMSARPTSMEADSLQSDIEDELDADLEDELTVKSPPAIVPFDMLPSPCPEPHSKRVGFFVAMLVRPLRC